MYTRASASAMLSAMLLRCVIVELGLTLPFSRKCAAARHRTDAEALPRDGSCLAVSSGRWLLADVAKLWQVRR
ncbi:hypothetical protein XFF6166_480030 [Xanthomonas citri pv. fuscans]|nr:hypothetical protein XFF6166_480030 [Xanthomonas citri pv. fuscans]SON99643.1 hypothetical protein XFF6960_190021 [Xanthomonas citri pv. fuscans]SOO01852.1 hypothetical protein XFF7767_110022 [Xanthomonas citri pv. fuscans]SOO08512.1 hypothetical protein XFF6970_230034 [Xanthomonas citri pv. fuscans]SOO15857.1 hypothetical protein XFF7766_680022 [Xanthomonas citri pv. fuscans]